MSQMHWQEKQERGKFRPHLYCTGTQKSAFQSPLQPRTEFLKVQLAAGSATEPCFCLVQLSFWKGQAGTQTYLCGRSPFTWELATRLMLSWIQTFCLQTLSQSSRTQASIRSADVKDSLIRNTLGFVLSIYNSCAKPAMLAVISVGLTNLMKTIIMVIHVIASQ